MEKLDYTVQQIVQYNNEEYQFNPYSLGIGLWRKSNGHYVDNITQKKLNKQAFGIDNLPNMIERFKVGDAEKKERLKQISIQWLQAKTELIRIGHTNVPDSVSASYPEILGGMFYYQYDPKTKDKLLEWDRFPLTIILEKYSDGFLGLNLHYISGSKRDFLLNVLLDYRYYDPIKDVMKVGVTYRSLIGTLKNVPEFKYCIKKYLTNHIKGKVLRIRPHEWGLAVLLPLQEFKSGKVSASRKKG